MARVAMLTVVGSHLDEIYGEATSPIPPAIAPYLNSPPVASAKIPPTPACITALVNEPSARV